MPAAGCPRARIGQIRRIQRIQRIANRRRSSLIFIAPFAIRRRDSPFAIRAARWVSTNARTTLAPGARERMCGCPQTEPDPHPVSVGARHAVPLPFPDQQTGVLHPPTAQQRCAPTSPPPFAIHHSPFAGAAVQPAGRSTAAPRRFQPVTAPGFGIVSDSLAMSRQGGLRTRPYPDPTIRYSPFAIRRFFPSAIRRFHHSPLATRHSPLAVFRRLRENRDWTFLISCG